LSYVNDDGTLVEPEFYVPIIPMILINGSKGIGTGYSADIPSYNPTEIVEYIQHYLETDTFMEKKFVPYYEGFTGIVREIEESKYLIKGVYQDIDDSSICVTELPIGTWTEDYKAFIEKLMNPEDDGKSKKKKKIIVKDYSDMSTDTKVEIVINFTSSVELSKLKAKQNDTNNGLEEYLNLTTTVRDTNMNMFDHKQRLRKYKSVNEIIQTYIPVRMDFYVKRKQSIISKLENELKVLSNKAKFITQQLNDEIDLRRKKKIEVVKMLESNGYDVINGDAEFKYLRNMPIDSVIEENVEKLLKEKGNKQSDLDKINATTVQSMWKEELKTFVDNYKLYKEERSVRTENVIATKKKVTKKAVKKLVKKKNIVISD
jgi:DNA topoisomerase-2